MGTEHVSVKCLVLGAANAGKTSLLRRFFHNTFENSRVPTLGSDFYSSKVDEADVSLFVHVWDTPGRERIAPNNKASTTSLGAGFFENADAILLVYDMTSSTSFTQLLKWFSDLRLMTLKDGTNVGQLPILLVANKMDLWAHKDKPDRRSLALVSQRDVMGLNRHFKGKDFHYEYQVSSPSTEVSNNPVRKRMEISSFLGTHENWTDDWSYLASLLHTEDLSHPDREMVLLWCKRNGLQHCEASAATGEGVKEAIQVLLKMAKKAKLERDASVLHVVPATSPSDTHLDLHKRYVTDPSQQGGCWNHFLLSPLRNTLETPLGL